MGGCLLPEYHGTPTGDYLFGPLDGIQTWQWVRQQAGIPPPRETPMQILRSTSPIFRQPSCIQITVDPQSRPIDVVTRIERSWSDLQTTDGHAIYWRLHLVDRHARLSPTVLAAHSIQLLSNQARQRLHSLTYSTAYEPYTSIVLLTTTTELITVCPPKETPEKIIRCRTPRQCPNFRLFKPAERKTPGIGEDSHFD